jgi:tRNA 2-selenouridine synthase
MKYVEVDEISNTTCIILDVRAPIEFEESHIQGAVNMPLLNNEAREMIGKTYKSKGKDAAIELGYQLVNPIRNQFIDFIDGIGKGNQYCLYCARGGLRSKLMAEFLSENGVDVKVLKGGYKAYRNAVVLRINEFSNLRIIGGHTGSGKTQVLEQLYLLGEQVLDLEAMANHKGSAFGGLGQNAQESTAQFHNKIFSKLKDFNPRMPLWIENESIHIGKVNLPIELWEKMKHSEVIEIIIPKEKRIQNILKDYGNYSSEDLINCLNQIEKRLGIKVIKELSAKIMKRELHSVVEILLNYYDEAYEKGRLKRVCQKFVKIEFNEFNSEQIARILQSSFKWKIGANDLNLQIT